MLRDAENFYDMVAVFYNNSFIFTGAVNSVIMSVEGGF